MLKRATALPAPTAFSALPVRTIVSGSAWNQIAVHIHGELDDAIAPVVCIPGYVRNMIDFAHLPGAIDQVPGTRIPFILVDLPGRGRSAMAPKNRPYSTPRDADVVLDLLHALDIPRAVLLGEGHGGQVAMLAAARHPAAVAGAVLIDSGPVTDPRGLVRTRNNFRHLTGLRGQRAAQAALRKILSADYPGEPEAQLDSLAERIYLHGPRGRLHALFDSRLIEQLEQFDFDDVLEPQWPLFDALSHCPLMLVRTQLSDQLRRATFDEMARRRPDAATLLISGQGSPALLDGAEERDAIAAFLHDVCAPKAADEDEDALALAEARI